MFRTILPNFFLVGTGKAGTTSLHRYLAQHPQIYMSPVKEPCYFAGEVRTENLSSLSCRHLARESRHPGRGIASDWNSYVELFSGVRSECAIGEASAIYLWSETAARNIHACAPDARIVMILRDPAERAYSHYLHQLSTGLIRASFHDHIQTCLKQPPGALGIHYPFLEIGLYARQVRRYLDLFPRDRIRIYWYEESWRDPACFLGDIHTFLGVDPNFTPDLSERWLHRRSPRFTSAHYWLKQNALWYPLRGLLPDPLRRSFRRLVFREGSVLSMRATDRRLLVDYYREDIRELSGLLHRDLSAWLH